MEGGGGLVPPRPPGAQQGAVQRPAVGPPVVPAGHENPARPTGHLPPRPGSLEQGGGWVRGPGSGPGRRAGPHTPGPTGEL